MSYQRRLFLSPYQQGNIAGLKEVLNTLMFEDLPHLQLQNIFLASLLQCGADKIQYGEKIHDDVTPSPSLQNRVMISDAKEWLAYVHAVEPIINDNIITSMDQEVESTANRLVYFLADLLYCCNNNLSYVKLVSIPSEQVILKTLSQELSIPLCHLLRCIETETTNHVICRQSISKMDVAIFEEIFVTSEFERYKEAYLELDNPDNSVKEIAIAIRDKSTKMVNRFPLLLESRSGIVDVFHAGRDVIEEVCGKLFASTLTASLDVLKSGLVSKRIAMHDTSDLYRTVLRARFAEYQAANQERRPREDL